LGKGGEQARWHCPVEHDKNTMIVGAADKPTIGLPQPQTSDPVRVLGTAERRFASPVQYVGARPRDPVEDE
jgi:hypothetical protein